jgi:hypothetical protein
MEREPEAQESRRISTLGRGASKAQTWRVGGADSSEPGRIGKARSDVILLPHGQAHFQDTIRQKDQKIAFLHVHVSQLTQSIGQFALKPGEEEIKKKGRWQFWRR